MEKFTMSQVIQKMIVETDGKMKQAQITERFANRKAFGKEDKATWEKMRNDQQAMIKSSEELLAFLEEIKKEYEKE